MFDEDDDRDEGDYEYDEVRGSFGRKPKMAALNKSRLSKYEMDDLFTSEDVAVED